MDRRLEAFEPDLASAGDDGALRYLVCLAHGLDDSGCLECLSGADVEVLPLNVLFKLVVAQTLYRQMSLAHVTVVDRRIGRRANVGSVEWNLTVHSICYLCDNLAHVL